MDSVLNPENKIVWVGPFVENSGYSYMNREHVRGLCNSNWDVYLEEVPCPMEVSQKDVAFIRSLKYLDERGMPGICFDPQSIKIVGWIPLKKIPPFKHNVLYTMMESKEAGAGFIDVCNEFYNSCWVPTEYCKKSFIDQGVKVPVNVVPIGVDPIYHPDNVIPGFNLNYEVFSKRENAPFKPLGFKFLSVFRWSYRKGFDVLLKSYLREFKHTDDVSLVIVSKHASASREKRFEDAVRDEIQEYVNKFSNEDSPPIYWCKENIPADKMPSMYAVGDCFVLPSRGEGLALPALEAAKMGLPCILPNHTAFSDYVTDENCFTFDVDDWEVCDTNPKWGVWITRVYSGERFPIFGDSVVDNVSYLMRKVFDDPEKGKEKNKEMQKTVDNKFAWDKCTQAASNCLKEIIN